MRLGLILHGDSFRWAAGRFILMTCRWDNSYSTDGAPLLGSGAWSAQYVNDCDAS
jgi:hypothetical protein